MAVHTKLVEKCCKSSNGEKGFDGDTKHQLNMRFAPGLCVRLIHERKDKLHVVVFRFEHAAMHDNPSMLNVEGTHDLRNKINQSSSINITS